MVCTGFYPPMDTFDAPLVIVPASQASPDLAAAMPPIVTLVDPADIGAV